MVQLTIQQALDLALQHHQAGRLQEAEQLYRQVLAQQPGNAGVMHNLGVVASQLGRNDVAVNLIRRALALKPNDAEARNNLGCALAAAGHLNEAITSYKQAILLRPNYAEAHYNLGIALYDKGEFGEAITSYRRAIELKPNYAEAHGNLGNALKQSGQLDPAIAAYRRAIALNSNVPESHSNLGNALNDNGEFDAAIVACRQAISLSPNYAEAHSNLGNALKGIGQLDEAITSYRDAVRFKPDFAEGHHNLGIALQAEGRFDEAITASRCAIALKPNYAEAYNNLGNALKDTGQLDEAIAAYRDAIRIKPDFADGHHNLGAAPGAKRYLDEAIASYWQAIRLKPDYAEAYNNLGNELKDAGQLDEAIAAYRDAIRIKPGYAAMHSNLVYLLHFHPEYDGGAIAAESNRWNDIHARPLEKEIQGHRSYSVADKRLKIGYVSPMFFHHAEAHFVLPLLACHDHERFDIHCFSCVRKPDEFTEQHRRLADMWHDAARDDDKRLAERIREAHIDIMVDLAMHLGENRLMAFARKPAPVQVTWLAYPGGTGLRTIDYRLTDSVIDPPGDDDSIYAEESIRLPGCWCCYDPLSQAEQRPLEQKGPITFGSLNNPCKINPQTLRIWVQVMRRVADSRLLLLCISENHRKQIRRLLDEAGIRGDRIDFVGTTRRPEYLRQYDRVDIGLDPLPYNGITTTCDALWMGVPVVTLKGTTAAGRAGASVLMAAGLPELVADSPDHFVQIAGELGNSLPQLTQYRATLRERLVGSPLTDGPRFARAVEDAYRQMWRVWCEACSAGS